MNTNSTNDATITKARQDFLLKMYETLNKEIDRHINSIWQIIGVIISTLAIFALVEKKVLTMDYASSVLILVLSLGVAYVIEANFWYNRNLVIIANIERQFLFVEDQEHIHYYFAAHRSDNKLLDMMRIQLVFIITFIAFVIFIHFNDRVYEGLYAPFSNFEFVRSLPYIFLAITTVLLIIYYRMRIKDYNEFKSKSPGIEVPTLQVPDTSQVPHSRDHPTKG